MRKHWNDPTNEYTYRYIQEDAIEYGRLAKGTLFPEDLSNSNLKTKSKRIQNMLNLAYTLGMLRGVRMADEMKDSYS